MDRKMLALIDLEAIVFPNSSEKKVVHELPEKVLKKIKGGFSLSEIWECLFAVPEPRYELIDGKFVDVNPCSILNREDR
jgi:hypothetical protein